MNLSAIIDYPLLCIEYIFISLFCKNDFNWSIVKLTAYIYFLFGLRFDSSKNFWNALVIVIPFLSFKGITHAYLL